MNWYFVAAAALAFVTGLTHTIFGERWIFKRMRAGAFIPTNGGQVLREPHVRILWATWHLVTVSGWLIAALIFWMALPPQAALADSFIPRAMGVSWLASSALVFIGTKGKHLGWAALLGVGILTFLGAR